MGQITEGFQLKAPSTETWNITVEKRDYGLFLVSGWEDFVKAHELQENDLLLFTCCGNSSFEVIVFEASGYEKMSSLFGNRTGPDMCKQFKDMPGSHGERYSLSDSEDTTTPSQMLGSHHNNTSSDESTGKSKPSE